MNAWPDPNASRADVEAFVRRGQPAEAEHQRDAALPRGWAKVSPCGIYRYHLGRYLSSLGPRGLVVMLNPSTADAMKDDPTISSLKRRAIRWGWGSFEVVNLFAFRSSTPPDLLGASDPIGPDNDGEIAAALGRTSVHVAAWGGFFVQYKREKLPPSLRFRDVEILQRMVDVGDVHVLGVNQDTEGARLTTPTHPLARGLYRVPEDSPLRCWKRKGDRI